MATPNDHYTTLLAGEMAFTNAGTDWLVVSTLSMTSPVTMTATPSVSGLMSNWDWEADPPTRTLVEPARSITVGTYTDGNCDW